MKRLFVAFACVMLLPVAVWPQASSSTVRGTVTDTAGAVVPNASVKLTNTATNVARSTVTNEAGLYVFPGAIPGAYLVMVEAPGMQKFEGSLTVHLQQDA